MTSLSLTLWAGEKHCVTPLILTDPRPDSAYYFGTLEQMEQNITFPSRIKYLSCSNVKEFLGTKPNFLEQTFS
jgi:hypothetical protein